MKYYLNGKVAAYDRRQKKYYVCQSLDGRESQKSHYGTGSANEQVRYYFETFAALRERSFDLAVEHIAALTAGRKVSVLDIGSSYGLFLKKVRDHGWEGVGIEPSRNEASFSRAEFGLEIFETTIEDFASDREWDVITLWDVFEHLPNPQPVLEKIRTMLSDEGTLVIRVPNARGLVHRLSFLAYAVSLGRFSFPVKKLFENHEYIYTQSALDEELQAAGFRRLRAYGEPFLIPKAALIKKKSYLVNKPKPIQIGVSHLLASTLRLASLLAMDDSLVVYFGRK